MIKWYQSQLVQIFENNIFCFFFASHSCQFNSNFICTIKPFISIAIWLFLFLKENLYKKTCKKTLYTKDLQNIKFISISSFDIKLIIMQPHLFSSTLRFDFDLSIQKHKGICIKKWNYTKVSFLNWKNSQNSETKVKRHVLLYMIMFTHVTWLMLQ